MAASRDGLKDVRDWIEARNRDLEAVGPTSNDRKTALQQQEKLRNLAKRIADYEPTFKEATSNVYAVIATSGREAAGAGPTPIRGPTAQGGGRRGLGRVPPALGPVQRRPRGQTGQVCPGIART